ncbi:hypothetical protein CYMTET_20047 [Cymbomonas tetramitiformis]|uniref:Uncharacterized protein n=1 Tax=Cymbomonas tetramitiformis TaxID=36881 RepID=A0AAE0L4C6_9CHLO|nr:hypothetical protein CYMTET_20047 [Cymbomonas tetramitiformis]
MGGVQGGQRRAGCDAECNMVTGGQMAGWHMVTPLPGGMSAKPSGGRCQEAGGGKPVSGAAADGRSVAASGRASGCAGGQAGQMGRVQSVSGRQLPGWAEVKAVTG